MSDLASFAVLLRFGSNVATGQVPNYDNGLDQRRRPQSARNIATRTEFARWNLSFAGKIFWKKGGLLIPNYLSPISMLRLLCKENMRQSLFHRLSHFFARPQTKIFSMSENLSERLKFSFLSKIISPQVDCCSSKCENVSQGIHNTWKCLESLVKISNCLFPT